MEEMTKADLALEQVWEIADELGRRRWVLEDNGVLQDDPAVLDAYDRTYRKVRALVETLPLPPECRERSIAVIGGRRRKDGCCQGTRRSGYPCENFRWSFSLEEGNDA
jgi:hypothetical protein